MAALAPLRLGVLGAARIAPLGIIRPARAVAEASIVAVAARDPNRARLFASKHGVPRVHRTYEDMLGDPEIDAVYNPLPNSLHARWSIAALKAGKHVLCEKPLAANAAEAADMARVGRETGLVLMEAFHYRYHPLAARLKAIVDSGELGTIRHLEAYLCFPLLLPNHIAYRYDLAGGATMDLGCYPINLIRFLAGAEPEVIRAEARLASPQVDRFMQASFRFADGRTARMVCSILSLVLLRSKALVRGDRGELRVLSPFHPQYYHRIKVKTQEGTRVEKAPGQATYTHQLRAFVQAVRGKAPIPTDAAEGVANMRIIDAVYLTAGLLPRGTTRPQDHI